MRQVLRYLTPPAWMMLVASFALSILGVLCILAAEGQPRIPSHATLRQMVYLLVGLTALLILTRIGYQRLGRWSYFLFGVGIFFLLLLALARAVGPLPLIPEINHTYRWIKLPVISFQPSEVMKVLFVIGLAWYLRHKENVQKFPGLVGPLALTVFPMLLILIQPDLGTTLLFMPVLFVMLYAAGARPRHLSAIIAIGIACVPIFWIQMKQYQRDRITGMLLQYDVIRDKVVSGQWENFISPQSVYDWQHNDGYQLTGSLCALGNGGLLGRGWKQGTYVQYDFLPAKHNDFIFAIIGEQWGFVGCAGVLMCFWMIAASGLGIAARTHDPFGRLLAVGGVSLITIQMLINVGMTIGLMPITGLSLPFVSAGGSSLVTNYLMLGLLVSVSQHRPFMLVRNPFTHRTAKAIEL